VKFARHVDPHSKRRSQKQTIVNDLLGSSKAFECVADFCRIGNISWLMFCAHELTLVIGAKAQIRNGHGSVTSLGDASKSEVKSLIEFDFQEQEVSVWMRVMEGALDGRYALCSVPALRST
jgi:hypothetical protein